MASLLSSSTIHIRLDSIFTSKNAAFGAGRGLQRVEGISNRNDAYSLTHEFFYLNIK